LKKCATPLGFQIGSKLRMTVQNVTVLMSIANIYDEDVNIAVCFSFLPQHGPHCIQNLKEASRIGVEGTGNVQAPQVSGN